MPDNTTEKAFDANREQTFVSHLMALSPEVSQAWETGDVTRINKVRSMILALDKFAGELRKQFDDMVDKRDAGFLGADFAPGVERMRKLREDKPKEVKPSTLSAFE